MKTIIKKKQLIFGFFFGLFFGQLPLLNPSLLFNSAFAHEVNQPDINKMQVTNANNAARFSNKNVLASSLEQEGLAAFTAIIDRAKQQNRLLKDEDSQTERVNRILQRLIPFALKWNDRAKDWSWEVRIIRSSRIDAIGLPGGKIILYSGMLNGLRLTDSEIAQLISHLIAHSLREHARGQATQTLKPIDKKRVSERFHLLLNKNHSLSSISMRLLTMHYKSTDETEADVIGADIAARAGFSPRAALSFWKKMNEANQRRWRYFSAAHPFTQAREKDLKKRLPSMLRLYKKEKE